MRDPRPNTLAIARFGYLYTLVYDACGSICPMRAATRGSMSTPGATIEVWEREGKRKPWTLLAEITTEPS